MARSQIMNLCKDSKSVKRHFISHTVFQRYLFCCSQDYLHSCVNFLRCVLSMKALSKNIGYPCIFDGIELSFEGCKRQRYFLVSWAHTDGNRVVNCIHPASLEKPARLVIICSTTRTGVEDPNIFICIGQGLYLSI